MSCRKSSDQKVFYPVRDETLCAVWDNMRHVLNAVTDVFTYREYVLIRSGFLLMAEQVLCAIKKEVELTGGVMLDSALVSTSSNKSVALDDEILLSAVLDLSLQKTAAMIGDVALSGDAQAVLEKEISHLESGVKFGGAVTRSMLRSCVEIDSSFLMEYSLLDADKSVDLNIGKFAVRVLSEFDVIVRKTVRADCSVSFGASIDCVLRRYRTIGDLVGLTFADVQDWNLNLFYYLEV